MPIVRAFRIAVLVCFAAFVSPSSADAPASQPARATTGPASSAIRVACAGDSMTRRPIGKSYSDHLGKLLGGAYDVRNFGHDGCTALKDSGRSFWKMPEFEGVTAFEPNVVILMLGTNDASSPDEKRRNFADDFRAMVKHFQSLPGRPRVIVMTPPPLMFGRDDHRLMKLRDELSPIVRTIAADEKLTFVELQDEPALADSSLYPDKVHLNEAGAKIVAGRVWEALEKVAK